MTDSPKANQVLLDVAPTERLTPMQRQYKAVKEQYPDVLVMFRMGDFYEMFGEDATRAAPVLEVVLTSRDSDKTPMCGVPYHSVDRYIAKLLAAGMRVAVCDQVEDPKKAKGLVRREVTRVVSAGTVLEDSFLPQTSNNFLTALASGASRTGLAVADISTGEFLVTEFTGEGHLRLAVQEIERLRPAECVVKDTEEDLRDPIQSAGCALVTAFRREGVFTSSARQSLLEHFQVSSLRGYGCEEMESAQEAAALLLGYLERTNRAALSHLRSLSAYSTSAFMQLDAPTRRNLELTVSQSGDPSTSLLRVLDRTRTPMGARLLRRWLDQPLIDMAAIRERQDAVAALVGDILLRGDAREHLEGVQDIERIASRVASGAAGPRDLLALARSLDRSAPLVALLGPSENERLSALGLSCGAPEGVCEVIRAAISPETPLHLRDGGVINSGYSSELDELRDTSRGGKEWITLIEQRERERTGFRSLKVGYNSVFGYYIEVSKAHSEHIPEDYIRKQTTTNAERYITPELKEHESRVLGAQEKAVSLEQDIFSQVRSEVAKRAQELLVVARAVAEIDALQSLAEVAHTSRWTPPELSDSDEILIQAGRHPVVECALGPSVFIPNDTTLDTRDNCLLIITGPNMAGKSTYLRQVALIVLLAQIGSFVPADRARVSVVDRIFTRIGARDDLASAQSTFMVEMNETANILNNATERSLILLDEIGRGTSTYDGLSIAWAVAEHILQLRARTLFATHYHHLNDLASQKDGVRNYRVAVKEEPDRIIWLHKIMPGGTDRSYGVQVARLAGLPEEVILRAEEILKDLESAPNSDVHAAPSETALKRQQLTLFEAAVPPVVEKLRKLDIQTMSPVEALTALWQLQKEAEEG
ncbi:MAG: DNA mismatch repair protein MutS [Armatimonadetes bacterium]|nr:DNA mismatch repair protein MutS [Armatimonadota bacterium]